MDHVFHGTLTKYIAGDTVSVQCQRSEEKLRRDGKRNGKYKLKQKRSVAEKSRVNSSKEDGNIALADVFPRVELLSRKCNFKMENNQVGVTVTDNA